MESVRQHELQNSMDRSASYLGGKTESQFYFIAKNPKNVGGSVVEVGKQSVKVYQDKQKTGSYCQYYFSQILHDVSQAKKVLQTEDLFEGHKLFLLSGCSRSNKKLIMLIMLEYVNHELDKVFRAATNPTLSILVRYLEKDRKNKETLFYQGQGNHDNQFKDLELEISKIRLHLLTKPTEQEHHSKAQSKLRYFELSTRVDSRLISKLVIATSSFMLSRQQSESLN